ncbi:MAG: hypothetical protein ACM3O3_13150 [Syntrophothermus sp.]
MKKVNKNQNMLYSLLINSTLDKIDIKKKMIKALILTRDVEIAKQLVNNIVDENNYETFLNSDNFSNVEIENLLKEFNDDKINEKTINEIKKDVDRIKDSIDEIKLLSKELAGLNPDYIYVKTKTGIIVLHKSILKESESDNDA